MKIKLRGYSNLFFHFNFSIRISATWVKEARITKNCLGFLELTIFCNIYNVMFNFFISLKPTSFRHSHHWENYVFGSEVGGTDTFSEKKTSALLMPSNLCWLSNNGRSERKRKWSSRQRWRWKWWLQFSCSHCSRCCNQEWKQWRLHKRMQCSGKI